MLPFSTKKYRFGTSVKEKEEDNKQTKIVCNVICYGVVDFPEILIYLQSMCNYLSCDFTFVTIFSSVQMYSILTQLY